MPSFSLCSFGTDPWVINEGISVKDSTPPKDSARVNTLTCSENFLAALIPPKKLFNVLGEKYKNYNK